MSTGPTSAVDRLYRILDFSRVVQIFEKKELYFAHPSTWDDPYEKRMKHQGSHALFAQCWSKHAVSDAMWRIYSQHHMGVRISTTRRKLIEAVGKHRIPKGGWIADSVAYVTQKDLENRTRKLVAKLKDEFEPAIAAGSLFWKREAFAHEGEWRIAIYQPQVDRTDPPNGIALAVDPHELITNIQLDPRAPQELVDAFTFYFKEKLKYKSSVQRSRLYRSPVPIEVEVEPENTP